MENKLMQRFLHNYYLENPNRKKVNKHLIYDMRNESIIDYIVDAYKSLELIRYIKLLDFQYIDKPSKFDIDVVNRKHLKSKLDKNIKKFINIDESRYGLLRAKFKLKINGERKIKEVDLLLPKQYKNYYLLLGGNKFYPIYQLVDSSTYNNKDYIVLKSMFMPPIIVKRKSITIVDSKNEKFKIPFYTVFLFRKNINPLLYYLATFGIENLMLYLNMEDIISITEEAIDDDEYYCFKTKKLYVNVIKYFFDEDYFCQNIVGSLIKLFNQFKTDYEMLYDLDYWCLKLGTLFTTNPNTQYDKGKNVVLSFYRLLDTTTYKNLKLREYNKANTYAVLRWMMRNFSELKSKDNMDLKNKRIRLHEYVAFYFVKRLSTRANNLLSRKNVTMEDLEDLLNFPKDDLIKQIYKSKSPLLRYDNTVNDMDLFTALKFSVKGPGSLGEKSNNAINVKYRGIHHSHVGRIDLNTSGTSDPGMSGIFVPFIETAGSYFYANEEPQTWDYKFCEMYEKYFGKKYKLKSLIYSYIDSNNMILKYEDVFHFIKYDKYYYKFNDNYKLNSMKKIKLNSLNKKRKPKIKKIKLNKIEDTIEIKKIKLQKF